MQGNESHRAFAVVTAVMAVIIIGGSLYPFDFSEPPDGAGPVRSLLRTLTDPIGRGNFLANTLLYMPLGFFQVRAGLVEASTARVLLATVTGAVLSLSMELLQYYAGGRESTAIDVYANVLGAGLGALAGCVLGSTGLRRMLLRDVAISPIPILLLAAWLGWRLFPYVPAIDLHKYWDALKPVVLYPSLSPYDLFRHSAIWLTVGLLLATTLGQRRTWLFFPLFAGAVLFAKVLIITATLSVAEIAGAAVAFVLLMLLGGRRAGIGIATVMLGFYVVALRLQPWEFQPYAVSEFGWVPFRSFVHGAMSVNTISFLEKFFLYGSLIWLLTRLGLRLWLAAPLVVALLFATSRLQVYLPGRSAESTDAVMALLIAVIFGIFNAETRSRATRPQAARPPVHARRVDGLRGESFDRRA